MSAVDLRCINCDVRLSRLRRHVLSAEDDNLVTIIQRWTYPRNSSETDCICHACWELANYQLLHGNGQAHSSQQVGHRCLCINCGRSILRARRRQLVRPNASEGERMIAAIISTWIHPHQPTSVDQVCVPCWLRAQRASRGGHPTGPSNINQPLQSGDANNSPGHPSSVNVHPDLPEIQESNLPNNEDNHIACINCDMQTSQSTGHCLSTANENLVAIIKLWTFPRAINTSDYICDSCWVIGIHQLQHTCIVCGTSTIETESHIINHASEEETQIVAIVNQRIQPRQVTSNEPICVTCWEQAQQELLRRHEHQLRAQTITLPNLRRVPEAPRHCLFSGCRNSERFHVPDNTRRRVLIENNFFIPRGSRVCAYHLGRNTYSELYTADYALDYFNPIQIEDMLFILMEENNFQFGDIQRLPDHLVHYWIGISKEQHQQILNETPTLRDMRRGSLALTALLCKLRTGDSNERLAALFQVPRRTLETLMNVARESLVPEFVDRHLGMGHISRERVSEKNSIIAEGLFSSTNGTTAIVIADGTYIYTQKSSNYLFQKKTYSLHKYRNLVKPFLVVCCDGYILDVFGPYSATTNDATILNNLLDDETFIHFFNDNDVFILDRGFRDSMDKLHDKNLLGHMPETLSPGHSQLTTLEGNRSRCVTINRWVVEAVNGQIKRDFKIFRQEYFNRASPHLMKDLKIACAVLNSFGTRFTDPENAQIILNIINERLFLENELAAIVAMERLNRRSIMFTNIDASNIAFPRLSIEELVLFACGTYQIRQARSYVGEHFRFHGIYKLEIGRDQLDLTSLGGENPFLLRAKIKSRHVGRNTYFVFIAVEREQQGRSAIIGYCCNCIVGLRTVGCCSHVMSVVWYLAYARHEGTTPPAVFLDNVLLSLE